MKESDLDIGVYLKDVKKEDEIWHKISEITKENVDLVVLNEAPASLVSNVFRTGIPLKIGDEKLYLELYLRVSSETEDFLKFVEDFRKIYKKSESLTPEIRIKLEGRIYFLELRMKEIEFFKQMTFEEYRDDIVKRRNIERWAETVLNAIIDIAKIILASEKKEMPRSYEEALVYFGLLVGMKEKEAKKFSEFADLRNILAHEYLDILYKRIQDFISKSPKVYKKIFSFLTKYLK